MNTTRSILLMTTIVLFGMEAQAIEPAATVNGAQISREQVDAQLHALISDRDIADPEVVDRLRSEVVEQLIAQQLLWQAADSKGYSADDDTVDRRFEELKTGFPSVEAFRDQIQASGFSESTFREDLKQRIAVERLITRDIAPLSTVTDDEIDAFYQANLDAMRVPTEVRARHILIRAKGDGDAAETKARRRIDDILTEARSGANFADLARQHSDGPRASEGGDLGYVGQGQLVAPLERAAFALSPGDISDVVRTELGYHIIKVEARRGGDPVTKAEVSHAIADYLTEQRLQAALAEFVQDLRSQSNITVYTEDRQ